PTARNRSVLPAPYSRRVALEAKFDVASRLLYHSRELTRPPMSSSSRTAFLAGFFFMSVSAPAQSVRVIRFSECIPFHMGEVTSRRIVHPDLGAKKTTLNYSVSQPGAEFAQHVHDHSDDTILVLQGEVDLRQGDSRRRFKAGEC